MLTQVHCKQWLQYRDVLHGIQAAEMRIFRRLCRHHCVHCRHHCLANSRTLQQDLALRFLGLSKTKFIFQDPTPQKQQEYQLETSMVLKSGPSHWRGIWTSPHLIHRSLGLGRVHKPNGILTGSAIFAGLVVVNNTERDKLTHTTPRSEKWYILFVNITSQRQAGFSYILQ